MGVSWRLLMPLPLLQLAVEDHVLLFDIKYALDELIILLALDLSLNDAGRLT